MTVDDVSYIILLRFALERGQSYKIPLPRLRPKSNKTVLEKASI